MIKMAAMSKAFIKNTVGTVSGKPRILNVDRGNYVVGYAEVNDMATTAFSRIRVNKGYFFCEPAEIQEGDLIQDRADTKKYLVMSTKVEMLNGECVYLDSSLYYCDATAEIERWTDGVRDTFGMVTDPAPQVIATEVPIVTNPQTFSQLEQQDRMVAQDKSRIYVQAKFGVKESDRITTSHGDTYKVLRIDKSSWPGTWICYVDVDVR